MKIEAAKIPIRRCCSNDRVGKEGVMNRSARFSEDRAYRYTLWRQWASGAEYVLIIGLNPSAADETIDDPTIRRCIGFVRSWGYGALCMVNLFAFRATNPKDMMAADDPIGQDNDLFLLNLSKNAAIVVAAWGVNGTYRNRDRKVKNLVSNLYCFGLTKHGHPKHPLYLPKSAMLVPMAERAKPKEDV